MNVYQFSIKVPQRIDDSDIVDAFYGRVDDASILVQGDRTTIQFDRESDSLDQAVKSAIADVFKEGWQVAEISIEPDCLLPLSTP